MLRIAVIACLVSCCLVLLDLWSNRDLFDPEGISYLDMADAYRRGEDVHRVTAAAVAGISPDEVSKSQREHASQGKEIFHHGYRGWMAQRRTCERDAMGKVALKCCDGFHLCLVSHVACSE